MPHKMGALMGRVAGQSLSGPHGRSDRAPCNHASDHPRSGRS
jgi:hypothetical protein